ncbi:EpsG family protein [Flavobacterium sp. FBOR7N2.3]|uniref:EpsG family protein n=1 Tax=Flavobacterium magnesitis TaxID=3138077 RepID=A0ABV4TF89_9FLAO
MLFSIIVLLYFIVIQFFANNVKHNSKDLSYVTLFFSFILLNILRIYCQSFFEDIPNYRSIFETVQSISFVIQNGYGLELYDADVEIGYRLLNSIFKFFLNDFASFLFFVSIIELSVFYFFCKQYKINVVNAFPVYIALTYITFEIGMLRQALAFCFFLLALIYINKKIVYCFIILLGFTFHKSILFCLIFLWSDKFIKKEIIYGIFCVSLALYILKIDIISYFMSYLNIEDEVEAGRVVFYMNVERENNFLGIGFWERIISFFFMNLIYVNLLKKNKVNKENNLIYNLGVFVILLQMIFFSSPTITSRLRYYIVIFPFIYISEYIFSEYKSNVKWGYQFLFCMYLFLYLYFQSTYLQ